MAAAVMAVADFPENFSDFEMNTRRPAVSEMKSNDLHASLTSSPLLSAARASDSISGSWASPAPLKSPAIPGKRMHMKQNPAVTANAMAVDFITSALGYPFFSILSSITNPSTGSVT